jgi:MFS family permease
MSHAAIGVVGYLLLIFATWHASLEQHFCQSYSTWSLFIISQVLNSICSNGMHLAIMCYIPTLAKQYTLDNEKRQLTANILYTVTNGAYAVGPLVLWVVFKIIHARNWLGLASYAGFTVVSLILISIIMNHLWTESNKRSWPKFEWTKFKYFQLIEFTIYNTAYTYCIVCFVAILTVRTLNFADAFSIMLPLIGIAMTIILSLMSNYWQQWSWNSWMVKFLTITAIGFIWTFFTILSTSLNSRGLWVLCAVIYCIFCPIYYSVTAYYFDHISEEQSRGILRGLIMAIPGPFLFSINAWITHGQKHGYIAFDIFNLLLLVITAIAFILRHHVLKWK